MMHNHRVSSSLRCSLLVSACLFLFSLSIFMQSLKIGSLNINGGRDRHKRALISEVATQKKLDVLFLQKHIPFKQMTLTGAYGGGDLVSWAMALI